jgi:hypothetical protein
MKQAQIRQFERLHREAHEAGMAAGNAAQPVPMIVGSPSTPFGNDIDPRQPQYYVADGVCGFAWVHLDGREPFAKFCKENGLGHKGYPKGFDVSVHQFGQSMARKEAYAGAYARVLRDHGIDAYVQSRMD